jgi:hypothetical protein
MTVRAPKDFWSGVMFIAFAAIAVLSARGYSFGTAGKMGPGYFPMALGAALGLIGAILVARSLFVAGEPVERIQLRPLSIIAIGVALFGALLEPLGLVVALIVVTLVAAFAGRDWRPLEAAGLAVALAAFSVGIFVVALRLPLPIWPSFL